MRWLHSNIMILRRSRGVVVLVVTCQLLGVPLTAQQAGPLPLVLQGVTVVDVTDGRLLPEQTVVVVGTRISAVGKADQVRVPTGARVVKGAGKYLIPGLWDMHIHPMRYTDIYYPLLIANGVTGIRDASTPVPLDTVLQWRRQIAAGARIGPRQVVAGPALDDEPTAPNMVRVATPADARRVVDSLNAAGVDFIKIKGGRQVYFAIAAEARRVGIPFGGHVPGNSAFTVRKSGLAVADVSDSGASIIDHSEGMHGACMSASASIAPCKSLAERFQRNGTWVVPTHFLVRHLSASSNKTPEAVERSQFLHALARRYLPAAVLTGGESLGAPSSGGDGRNAATDSISPLLRLDIMRQAGVPLLAGTDAGPITIFAFLVPGFSLHEELAALVWAGLTPLGALQAATLNPAKVLRATDSLGVVAAGKLADLVLLNANPLTDIRNVTKIHGVVANGRYFDRAALDELLTKVEQLAKKR